MGKKMLEKRDSCDELFVFGLFIADELTWIKE